MKGDGILKNSRFTNKKLRYNITNERMSQHRRVHYRKRSEVGIFSFVKLENKRNDQRGITLDLSLSALPCSKIGLIYFRGGTKRFFRSKPFSKTNIQLLGH